MANPDSVSQKYPDSFGNYAIATASAVSLATTGNAIVALPILSGGLTQGNAVVNSGGVIVRRVTVQNPGGNVAAANVAILTSSDGNTSNAVVASVVLANLTATGTYQDLTVATPYSTTTALSGLTVQALFVKINTASSNGTVDIRVYGDTVNF